MLPCIGSASQGGLCGQVLTGEVERLRKLLEEKDALITQWRQEADAAQEAADAASHAVREAEEYSLQACSPLGCTSGAAAVTSPICASYGYCNRARGEDALNECTA